MAGKSIILIGMPGSGKSTIGKSIADKLGMSFIDTDRLIIDKYGMPLQQIIKEDGLEGFMKKEEAVLTELDNSEYCVIATGGSAVLYEKAMEHIKTLGTVVFLDADLPLISKRLWNMDSRGIAFASDEDGLLGVYMEREPLYYKYSDIRVHVRGKTVADITREITGAL